MLLLAPADDVNSRTMHAVPLAVEYPLCPAPPQDLLYEVNSMTVEKNGVDAYTSKLSEAMKVTTFQA